LPSSYDFPALITSIEKIANQDHIPLQGVGGTDQPSSTAQSSSTVAAAQPQQIPISFSVQTDFQTVKVLLTDLERSIRPVDITTITLSGSGNNMNVSLQSSTYYQNPISLQIKQKVVK
jgi:hypothetical protein